MVSKEMREGVEVEVDRREPLAAVAGQRRRLSTSAAMLPSFRSHLAPRSPRPARAVRSAVRALSRPRARRKRKRALHAALSLPKQRGENLLSHFERERKILKRGSSSFSAKLQEFRKMSAFFFCAPVSAAQLRFKRRRRRPVCHARTKMRAEEKRQRRSSSREGVLLERASFSFFGPSGRTIMKPPPPLCLPQSKTLKNKSLHPYSQVQISALGLQHDLDIVRPVVDVLGRDREREKLALPGTDVDKAFAPSERSLFPRPLLRVPPAPHRRGARSRRCDRCSGDRR